MAIVLSLKIAISVVVPASIDMIRIVNFALSIGTPGALYSPWVLLIAQILNLWLALTSSSTPPVTLLILPPTEMTADLRLLLLLLRLPTIMFDVGIAATLYYGARKITSSVNLARLTSLIWFINPYTILAVEMLGVPDVAATFFALAAALFLIVRKPIQAGLALGTSIALKLYPILFLPQIMLFALTVATRRLFQVLILGLGLLGLLVYFLWNTELGLLALPATLVAYTAVTTPMNSIFDFSSGYRISLTMFTLTLLYFLTWTYANNPRILPSQTILPVLLIYYVFADSYPQYLMWALPFVTMDVALVKRRNLIFLILISGLWFLLGLLYSDGYQTSSGYSLLLIPLIGQNLPWFSQAMVSLIENLATPIVIAPTIRLALITTFIVYAFEIIRGWFLWPKHDHNRDSPEGAH